MAELEKLGLHPYYHQLDIDDESSVTRIRDYLKEKYGGLDVLVNNAAIAFKMNATEPFEEQAAVTLRTNFFNTERACQILFPILKPHARVVNVSSSGGHLVRINGKEPAAGALRAKFASPDLSADELRDLMRSFIEYKHNILRIAQHYLSRFCSTVQILFTELLREEITMSSAGQKTPTWFQKLDFQL